MTRLVVLADTGNIRQRPVHHGDLHKTRPAHGNDLTPKRHPRRHLHVVRQLHVAREPLRLAQRGCGKHLEDHDGHRLPGEHEPPQKRREDVQGELDVGDAQNHARRDDEDEG